MLTPGGVIVIIVLFIVSVKAVLFGKKIGNLLLCGKWLYELNRVPPGKLASILSKVLDNDSDYIIFETINYGLLRVAYSHCFMHLNRCLF